jgi:hypothetical protein
MGFYIPEDCILHSHRLENLKSDILHSHCRENLKSDILHSHCRENLKSHIALIGWAL